MEGLDHSRPLSLYIHIPFCLKKCDYCAFYSLEAKSLDDDTIEKYVSLLLKEIKAVNDIWKKPYYTVFVGGGNPGVIGYSNLKKILISAAEYGVAEEVTIEINPENVSNDILSLKPYLNRVSVGIQSMNPKSLKCLGRNTSRDINLRALDILSSSNLNFNVDLMTCIPGTTIEDTLLDIDEIVKYNPNHISFYSLTFEEGTPLVDRCTPIEEEKEIEHLQKGWERLKSYGYDHYEISNFSKDGMASKHNRVYWQLGQYIGIGPTAESSIGYECVVSMRNKENLFDYLNDPAFDCIKLSKDETEEEFLLTSLRIKDGIDKKEYTNRFGYDFNARYSSGISMLEDNDYVDDTEAFKLTEEGMMRLDSIILRLALSV